VGTIVDETAHSKDVSAEIIELARLGYITIRHIEEKGMFGAVDYELKQAKLPDDSLPQHQQLILSKLFQEKLAEVDGSDVKTVKISDIKQNFSKDMAAIKAAVYGSVVKKKYFEKNPAHVRGKYTVLGVIAMIGAWFAGPILDWLGVIAIAISGLIVLIFSFLMPRKTKKGTRAREHILGLKEYLRVAEKDRLTFHQAPKKNPERFEKLLPYAMVLGVEREWAKQFEGMGDIKPAWYSGPSDQAFSAVVLSNSLKDFSSVANSAMTATASSGRSGFSGGSSGGGFGGGGGGSW